MALPSAPLGSMPSLNVPSYIPTVVVPRERKMSEQLLGQVLASVLGSAATQGIGNMMSRDYADTGKGESQANTWDKLLHGPKVDRAEYGRRQGEAATEKTTAGKMAFELAMEELRGEDEKMNRNTALNEGKLNRLQSSISETRRERADLVKSREGNQTSRDVNAANNQTSRDVNAGNNQVQLLLQQLHAGFDAPYRAAQIEGLSAQTHGQNMQNQFTERALNPQVQGKDAPPTPRQQAVMDRLQDTNRYPVGYANRPVTAPAPTEAIPAAPTPATAPAQASTPVLDSTIPAGIEPSSGLGYFLRNLGGALSPINPQDIMREVLQKRQVMASQTPEAQRQTAIEIDHLLKMLKAVSPVQ